MDLIDILSWSFENLLYKPIFNLLIFIYLLSPIKDLSLAIVLLTFLIKLVLVPLTIKSLTNQKKLAKIQKETFEIRKKLKGNQEKQAKAILELYQKEKVNPAGGCLPMLIQFPVLIALYRVFWKGFEDKQLSLIYSFLPHPEHLQSLSFFGLINLNQPSPALALATAFLQFFQSKKELTSHSKDSKIPSFQKQLLFLMPLLTFFILIKFPSALAIYWSSNIVFSLFERKIFLERFGNKDKIEKEKALKDKDERRGKENSGNISRGNS